VPSRRVVWVEKLVPLQLQHKLWSGLLHTYIVNNGFKLFQPLGSGLVHNAMLLLGLHTRSFMFSFMLGFSRLV
jgi:hypothetical protein